MIDYVEEIFLTLLTSNQHFKDAMQDLSDMTPPPMNTMLVKQPKAEAIQKKEARKAMTVRDVPPTTPGMQVQKVRNFSLNFISYSCLILFSCSTSDSSTTSNTR